MAFKINADKYAYSASPEKVSDNYAAELAKKLVAEEAAARVSGDDVLNTKIVQAIRDVAGAVLQKLDTETAERIAADEELQKNIDDTVTDTSAKLAAKADSTAIPYKVSQLENDSGYLTEHQDISGKADKADTYTKNEVDNLITPLQSFAEDAQTQLDATWSEKADKIEVNLRFDDVTVDISDLHNSKADKATTLAGYGITDAYTKEEVRSDISWLQVWCEENEYAIDDLEQKKADKATIETSEDTSYTFEFANTHNTEKRLAEVTSISFTFGDGEYNADYVSGLSFDSGETPTSIDYTDSGILNWVGTDCATSDGLSIFQPSANTHYDIVFYFNGTQFIGLVNGFVPATGNVVSE